MLYDNTLNRTGFIIVVNTSSVHTIVNNHTSLLLQCTIVYNWTCFVSVVHNGPYQDNFHDRGAHWTKI